MIKEIDLERRIRNSAKAVIFRDGKMLASKIKDKEEVFYIMPGGGQESGETLEEAVEREIAEEFGIIVKSQSLEFVIEGVTGEKFHRVDLVFLCEYIGEMSNAETIMTWRLHHGECHQITMHDGIDGPSGTTRIRRQWHRFPWFCAQGRSIASH